jgi:branched-chain amino acid transport system substrate-binding protein
MVTVASGLVSGTASAASSAPGVTSTSITINLSGGLSGIYGAAINGALNGGWTVWADDVNAHGGINGRQVIFDKTDNKFTPDGGVAACKIEQSNGSLFTLMLNGTNNEAQCLNDAHVPALLTDAVNSVPTGKQAWKYVRVIQAAPSQAAVLATYVKDELHGKGKKIGVTYDLGVSDDTATAFEAKAKAIGLNVVDVEAITVGTSDLTPQMLRMQNAGVQLVALLGGTDSLSALKAAATLNYKPVFTGAAWTTDSYVQAAPTLLQGMQAIFGEATVDSPAYANYLALCHHYQPSSPCNRDMFYLYGSALLAQKIIQEAGKNPTQASVLAGMNKIKNYSNNIVAPVTWGPGIVIGAPGAFPEKCCSTNNTWIATGPAKNTF